MTFFLPSARTCVPRAVCSGPCNACLVFVCGACHVCVSGVVRGVRVACVVGCAMCVWCVVCVVGDVCVGVCGVSVWRVCMLCGVWRLQCGA